MGNRTNRRCVFDWYTRWELLIRGKDIDLPLTYDKKLLREKVNSLVEKYSQEPKDAVPVIDANGHVTFTEGVPHISLDAQNYTIPLKRP